MPAHTGGHSSDAWFGESFRPSPPRGRHTTRHVELFRLSCGALAADTPGFSSFDMDKMELERKEKLQFSFREFAPYLGRCRFQDCAHVKEKGCAVLEAVKDGRIPQTRHQS